MSVKKGKQAKADAEWLEKSADPTPAERATAAKVASLEAENARLSRILGLTNAYRLEAGPAPRWAQPPKKPRRMQATACMPLSDLHLDETVKPAEVGGLNAYSRPIAEMRLRRWAEHACKLGDMFRHDWDGAIVFLNGDLVSGAIHDELRETNADCLPGTLVHWAPRLASALAMVAEFYGRLLVPVVVGNHGRLTEKKQAKKRGRNSWDWLLAQMVRDHLRNDPRVEFRFTEGSYQFVGIYDTNYYQTHGDEVHGGGGWAGIWSPLGTMHRRGVELAASHKLQMQAVVSGHWHTTVLALQRGLSCNGSLKGWDEYAASLRLRPEPAMQNWWVHSAEHGPTLAAPIFCEDKRAEGW